MEAAGYRAARAKALESLRLHGPALAAEDRNRIRRFVERAADLHRDLVGDR